jgi:sigma-B regulation protein RsbU (phosphoserine phosphatase)
MAACRRSRRTGSCWGFLEDACYTTHERRLGPGDRLLLYTDGLVEAENSAGEFYGLERVKASLGAAFTLSPGEAADAGPHSVDSWSRLSAADDLTLVLVERAPELEPWKKVDTG